MGIFSTILSKIFPSDHPAVAAAQNPPSGAGNPAAASTSTAPPSTNSTANMPPGDVEAVLNGFAPKNPEKLKWRSSIVVCHYEHVAA